VAVLLALFALVLGRGAAWLDDSALRGLTASQRASEIDTMRGYPSQVGPASSRPGRCCKRR
jgi:hypothetical protein